ncbi:MBL fold metallo-hydrolase [Nocardioides jishulii]|uniref:MBL fold metallo-hydrolase n=2 Tax=Nocardioides jishulii TaxID=2575440 RepID=A0A4U2YM20_9ACTN|nr:MBL fold metallo-hydrolase [Nocardioides jishulii]TKI62277.1 MBL fold metallo-hydrolase [Nocardioides jishulii]
MVAMTSYTGDVSPGGDPQTRTLSTLAITKVAVDDKMSNNCYLLRCTESGEQLLVDAADSPDVLLPLLKGGGLATVVTTHQHWDHHRALAAVVEATGAEHFAGAPDADAIEEQTGVEAARRLEHGDIVRVGRVDLDVIAIAGHTPGSVCLLHRDSDGVPHLFTGDSLFPGGVGSTFGDADAFELLIDQVEERIFGLLPDETHFYPGHGKDGLLGQEREHLPEWRARKW